MKTKYAILTMAVVVILAGCSPKSENETTPNSLSASSPAEMPATPPAMTNAPSTNAVPPQP